MPAKLILAPEAEQVIDDGYAWYERQRVGLGEGFLTRVEACIQTIRRTPKMHQAIHKEYRRGLVRQFPYAVFYEFANRTVTIYAVMHTSRDPKKWRERLP